LEDDLHIPDSIKVIFTGGIEVQSDAVGCLVEEGLVKELASNKQRNATHEERHPEKTGDEL
jgi:hypothetical protein